MTDDCRIQNHPVLKCDPSKHKKISFFFGGRRVEASEGDTVASALYASGVRTFSRSFKYHRPRGLFCVSGACPNCLMNVDGTPNVRTCTTPVREGMKVRHQNAWPSLGFDFFAVIGWFSRFLPVGFYYKKFYRPRFMAPFYRGVMRRVAGLGVIDPHSDGHGHYEHDHRHADVTIVGGGPAGLTAAQEAARVGGRVLVVDQQTELGGHLRYVTTKGPDGMRGFEKARKLAREVEGLRNVEIIKNATVFGCYDGGLLAAVSGHRLIKIRTKRLIVATGAYETPLIFHNNDLPGIFLGRGLRTLINLYGIRPGRRALVVTSNDSGYEIACELLDAGIAVAAVADSRSKIPESSAEVSRLKSSGVPLHAATTVKEAVGGSHVRGAVLVAIHDGAETQVDCDLISLSTGFLPAYSLLAQAGCKMKYDEAKGAIVPGALPENVSAVGEVAGAYEHPAAAAPICVDHKKKKKFVCLCEDVAEKDLCEAIAEGFDNIETLKRYSTVSMGPCQGKMCTMATIGICARETGRTMESVGITTARPPVEPVSLGVLAGPHLEPVKLTPMHHRHLALGAKMMDAGDWKRPEVYTTPEEEYRAVRGKVGVIDVSTLGKLEVRGKDSVRFLERIYTNQFKKLAVGMIRYGVMCGEDGIIIDDGTISRLGENHFFITTTSGNINAMEEWMRWWATDWGMSVHLVNVTSAYAAVNVAGPRARDVMMKLTDIDLSPAGFPYLKVARAAVAGIPSLLLRIGFTGEMGWEIHFPGEVGEYMWDTVMEAGREFGIAPFGIEAQRRLRLDKKHILVGQDTDALSNPLEADMEWIVKLDKPEFVGKASLVHARERGMKNRMVGFVLRDASSAIPEDGSAVVANGTPVGRITSSRFSIAAGKAVGLAWVPVEMSRAGSTFEIWKDDRPVSAVVVDGPFYDPEGKKLKA